jgi:hypothetical protein
VANFPKNLGQSEARRFSQTLPGPRVFGPMMTLWKGPLPTMTGPRSAGISKDLRLHLTKGGNKIVVPLAPFQTRWQEYLGEVVFADTRAYGRAALPERPPDHWLWVSYCGYHEDTWFDGPLARMAGDRIVDYVAPLGPTSLHLGPATGKTFAWAERPRVEQEHFLAAASAMRIAFPLPRPVTGWQDTDADAQALCCLAKAWKELQVVSPSKPSPRLRKLLLHLGGQAVPQADSSLPLSAVHPKLKAFPRLGEDLQKLSPIVPGL